MAQIAFAVFIVIWAVVMLEFWKRKEKLTVLEWGMIGFEDEEVDRPGGCDCCYRCCACTSTSLTIAIPICLIRVQGHCAQVCD